MNNVSIKGTEFESFITVETELLKVATKMNIKRKKSRTLYKIMSHLNRSYLIRYKELLVTLLIVTISIPVTAQEKLPSIILITVSGPMSKANIFDLGNYKVTANKNISVEVIKVGLVKGDSAVVLPIHKKDDRGSFQTTMYNLKDKSGNLINVERNYAEINPLFQKYIPVKLLGNK